MKSKYSSFLYFHKGLVCVRKKIYEIIYLYLHAILEVVRHVYEGVSKLRGNVKLKLDFLLHYMINL